MKEEGKKPGRYARAFTAFCGRNNENIRPAGRRIWNGNRQGGEIIKYPPLRLVLAFHLLDKLKVIVSNCLDTTRK